MSVAESGAATARSERYQRSPIPVLLAFAASSTLLARGWLTWRWDSPIRELIWREDLWSGMLEKAFGISWNEFAEQSDPGISAVSQGIGVGLMLLAMVPWIAIWRPSAGVVHLLWCGSVLLGLDSLGRWAAADFEFAMGIEHALQIAAPVLCWWAVCREISEGWRVALSVCAGLTFVGHGLYASGIYPVPLQFQTMTMKILSFDGRETANFLLVAGILDFVAVAGIWVKPIRRWALLYLIGWGFLTALARPVAHGLGDPWIAEMLVRTAHWALPLVLWVEGAARAIRSGKAT